MQLVVYENYNSLFYKTVIYFLCSLRTVNPKIISVFGFFTFLTILIQCLSGLMVALSYIGDPMLIPTSRDEEDTDDLYTDDFFFLHERGVDMIFILIFSHLLRKLYLNSFSKEQEIA